MYGTVTLWVKVLLLQILLKIFCNYPKYQVETNVLSNFTGNIVNEVTLTDRN